MSNNPFDFFSVKNFTNPANPVRSALNGLIPSPPKPLTPQGAPALLPQATITMNIQDTGNFAGFKTFGLNASAAGLLRQP